MNLAEAIEQIRPSIVQISFQASDLSEDLRKTTGSSFLRIPLGSGFFVSEGGYVITANHVLDSGRQQIQQVQAGQKRLLVGLAHPNTENMRGNFTMVEFDVIDNDTRHDLALFKLKKNPFRGEVRSGITIDGQGVNLAVKSAGLNSRRPSDGTHIGISGYPLQEPVLVTNGGWIASSWSFNISDVPIPAAPADLLTPYMMDTYLADVTANPGNSGGPVFSVEDGSILGVCVALKLAPVINQAETATDQLSYGSGLTIVVPTLYVEEMLAGTNVT